MKILIVFGTRPEAIKLAPLVHEARRTTGLQVKVCVTGQHQEMLSQVLDFFEIVPDYNLAVMRPNQDLTSLTARILDSIRPVLDAEKPDLAVVQGDTTTCFAASLAAFYARIPVAHVEAGLRTYDLAAPFPEEGMRQMTTRLASLHFAPTLRNRQALIAEGVPKERIVLTGNTVIDAVLWAREALRKPEVCPLRNSVSAAEWEQIHAASRLIMVTGHRRESFGEGIENICSALAALGQNHPEVLFVYPVHPNPNVIEPVKRRLGAYQNILLIKPLEYAAFVDLMNRSRFIITDSGGVQEEAPSLHKPVLVTRDVTERQEAVETGQVRLVGTRPGDIVSSANELLQSEAAYSRMISDINPYGDGHASLRIVHSLLAFDGPSPVSEAYAEFVPNS